MAPTLPGISGPAAVRLSGPEPSSASINPDESQVFTFRYSPSAIGSISFTMKATGIDFNSGDPLDSGSATTNSVTVQTSSNLTASVATSQASVNVGQAITVLVTVNNTGMAGCSNVTPALVKVGAGGVSAPSISPASASIAGSGSQQFTYIYTATSAGIVYFSGNASGTDANDGSVKNSNYSATSNVNIQQASALSASLAAFPSNLATGQTITLHMTVTNTGGAAANNVSPLPAGIITDSGTASASIIGSVSPSSYNIPGGEARVFTWRFTAAGTGTMHFTSTAQGTDANEGTTVSSASVPSNAVSILAPSPALSAALSLSRSTVSVGQMVTVIMTITNTGMINGTTSVYYTDVYQSFGGGAATQLTAPSSGVTVNAGGDVKYLTWTYSASAAGTVNFSGQAISYDGEGSTATAFSSNLAIQTPSSLSASFQALPSSININQPLTVVMAVQNNGSAPASNVRITEDIVGLWLTKNGDADVTRLSGPLPVSQTIAGSSTGYFTFVFNPTSAGTISFSGSSYGNDSNSGVAISSAVAGSTVTVVQSAANLVAQFNALPASVNLGRWFSVRMTVSNSGQGQATSVQPLPNALTRIGGAGSQNIYPMAPGPQTLNGGQAATFSWTFSASGTGLLSFSAIATGNDTNESAIIYSQPVLSSAVLLQREALLSASISAYPAVVSEGELITVVMTVTNDNGGAVTAAALNVSPTVMQLSGTGNASLNSWPSPLTITSITGGSSARLTWVYTATTAGNLVFGNAATGADANDVPQRIITSGPVASGTVQILPAAVLTSSFS
ncbi:MAG TPA: hypothetical protein P5511_04165, partial [Candidatus Goldiibacteriota bacterium]|nr:hypothetical protein [Candidatus Goldiibacteriota bacterium]